MGGVRQEAGVTAARCGNAGCWLAAVRGADAGDSGVHRAARCVLLLSWISGLSRLAFRIVRGVGVWFTDSSYWPQVGVFELYCPRARACVCVCVFRDVIWSISSVCGSLCSIPMRLVPVDLFLSGVIPLFLQSRSDADMHLSIMLLFTHLHKTHLNNTWAIYSTLLCYWFWESEPWDSTKDIL